MFISIFFILSPQPVLQAKKVRKLYLPVLMYHQISEKNSRLGEYVITPTEFENDLKLLKSKGYTSVTVSDLINYAKKGKKMPDKPVMITFDDGFQSDYIYAYPILKEHDMKACFSIVGEFTDRYSQEGIDMNVDYAYVSWDEVKEMRNSGVGEFLSHTYDMHNTRKRSGALKKKSESEEEYKKILFEDIEKINAAFKEHLGAKPDAFTCPFGCFDDSLKGYLKDSGYSAILISHQILNKFNGEPDELYRVGRIVRPHGMNLNTRIAKWEAEIESCIKSGQIKG